MIIAMMTAIALRKMINPAVPSGMSRPLFASGICSNCLIVLLSAPRLRPGVNCRILDFVADVLSCSEAGSAYNEGTCSHGRSTRKCSSCNRLVGKPVGSGAQHSHGCLAGRVGSPSRAACRGARTGSEKRDPSAEALSNFLNEQLKPDDPWGSSGRPGRA
ncbi:hypothetical protein [Streptomyces sp. NPDC046939]|uniref:hypothetical protein n=1 Tax=Streptomyces sp. NPDC046939 TaxID=3155376 RepID=UPI0033EC7E63